MYLTALRSDSVSHSTRPNTLPTRPNLRLSTGSDLLPLKVLLQNALSLEKVALRYFMLLLLPTEQVSPVWSESDIVARKTRPTPTRSGEKVRNRRHASLCPLTYHHRLVTKATCLILAAKLRRFIHDFAVVTQAGHVARDAVREQRCQRVRLRVLFRRVNTQRQSCT